MSEALLSNNPEEDIAPISPFGAIDYGISAEELEKLAGAFGDITQITNVQEQKAAQAAVTQLTRARTAIETRRKALKSESLTFGRLVDSTAKDLAAVVIPEEDRIKAMLDEIKAKQAAKRAEAERVEQERIDNIRAAIDGITALVGFSERGDSSVVKASIDSLSETVLTESDFQEFTQEAIDVKAGVIEQLQELYSGALHDERIAKQQAEQQAKEDAERKAEDERLAKEREELNRQKAEQAEAQAKIDAEQAEAKAKADAELQAERDKLAKEQAEFKAEQDRIAAEQQALIDAAEAERVAEEKAAAKAKADAEKLAKAEALKPDAEKLNAYVDELLSVAEPVLKSEEALARMENIHGLLAGIRTAANLIDQAA